MFDSSLNMICDNYICLMYKSIKVVCDIRRNVLWYFDIIDLKSYL